MRSNKLELELNALNISLQELERKNSSLESESDRVGK